MGQIAFTPRAYGRSSMGLAEARLINLYAEKTPNGPGEFALFPRPALVSAYSLGSGPIRGVFSQPGVFSGALFVVSATTAYLSDGTNLGTIAGTDLVRWAASPTQLVCVANGLAYLYEGSTFTQITDPDLPMVSDVFYLAGRFFYTVSGSDRFYFSEVRDAGNIDGLSFETAETLSDPNVGAAVLGDEGYFFGERTVEIWYATGDPDAPLQTSQGRQFDKGCASRDTIVKIDNAMHFLGHDRVVYRASGSPERVSGHGLEERLRRCTSIGSCTAFGATIDGHSLYVLNIPGQGSFCIDIESKEPSEWTAFGKTVFRGRCAVLKDGVNYVGDDTASTVWAMTPDVYLDGTDPVTFLGTAFAPNNSGKPIRCNNVVLQGARGVGLSGPANANRVTAPNDFSDPSWIDLSAGTTTVTANNTTAPDGTMTADRLVGNNANTWWGSAIGAGWAGKTATFPIWVWAAAPYTATLVLYFGISGGVTYSQNISVTTTPTLFTFTQAFGSADTGTLAVGINHGNGHTTYVWHAEAYDASEPTGGYNPVTEMRFSDDQGKTWSVWRAASVGKIGKYRQRAVWQRLGMISEPGRVFEFRTTDGVLATMGAVLINAERPHG